MSARRIGIGELASEAFDITRAHWPALLRLARFPLAISLVIFIGFQELPQTFLLSLALHAVKFAAMGVFAVAVHRYYLLGEAPELRFGGREIKFILFAMATTALWYFPLEFSVYVLREAMDATYSQDSVSFGQVLGAFFSVAVLFYAVLRLSLVFPLIATSDEHTLFSAVKYSWAHMSGNVLAFVVAAIVLSFIISLFLFLPAVIFDLAQAQAGWLTHFLRGAIDLCAGFLHSLFLVIFASYIYKSTQSET